MWWGARPHLLDRNRRLDRRMRVVTCDYEVVKLVVKQGFRTTFEVKSRQRFGVALEQLFNLGEVILVDVHITTGPDELTDLQVTLLCQHVGQHCVACDVKR